MFVFKVVVGQISHSRSPGKDDDDLNQRESQWRGESGLIKDLFQR